MNRNCKIHDFVKYYNRVYRCKNCGLLELADYFLSDIRIKHYDSFIDGACYVWHPEYMQASQIVQFDIKFGDCPIVNVSFSGNALTIQNSINGSRDGWMRFPEGFFDERHKVLTDQQVKRIRACLEGLHFEEWRTPEYVFKNASACGFCVNEAFSCTFPDGKKFVCDLPETPEFEKLVSLIKELI